MSTELAAGFDVPTVEEWKQAVQKKSPDADFVTQLEDGISVDWLYTPDDALAPDPGGLPGADPFTRGSRVGERWAIRQEHAERDRATANAHILEDLEGGATDIALRVDPDGREGIPVTTVDELDAVLDGVLLDLAPIALSAGEHAEETARLLVDLWRRREHDPQEIRGSLGLDPIGTLARRGTATDGAADAAGAAVTLGEELVADFSAVQPLAVDTEAYVEAGASGVLELAVAVATGITYLRAGEAAGVSPEQLAGRLEFRIGCGPDQFLEIAKFRALRRLWATVLEQCGVPAERRRSRTFARTSRRMVSSLDPWVNLLRGTTAAFAAGVGGADGITVLAFDEPAGNGRAEPGALGRRMARNTQLVLQEEASLHRVSDPGGGSWYVESLTDQVARAAWAEMQAIERDGGLLAVLGSGQIAQRLRADTERRQDELARRGRILTGVNTFPLLGDDGLERDPEAIVDPAQALPDESERALLPQRDASGFEHLRARAQAIAEADGREPTVLLSCMGPLSAHVSISLWAKSFFESGGIATVSSGPQTDDAAHAALLTEHGLTVAVVCPGRGSEPDEQRGLVTALREAGAMSVYLAGAKPDAAEAVGADVAVRDGVDMVAVLGDLLDRLGEATTAGAQR